MARRTALLTALALVAYVAVGCAGDGVTPVAPSAFIRVVSPNGGERWIPGIDHEIVWVSQYVGGTVCIEYSTDNFVSDVHTIATDEPNDGSFVWENIPSDPLDTVRVRISWTGFPGVSDVSDDDFRTGDFGWARTWGGTDGDRGYAVAIDHAGSIYVAGYFRGTTDFDPNSGDSHTSIGGSDVYLVKFDPSGSFKWVRTWGGPEGTYSTGVAADGSGSVYVVGYFWGTADFDPGYGDPHSSNGACDVFLSKFDMSGDFEWARTWGEPYGDYGTGVAVDDSGGVYVTGYFYDKPDSDSGEGDPEPPYGTQDVFLLKYNSSGNLDWERTWGGRRADYGYGVATDRSGSIYVTGDFEWRADFNPGGGDSRIMHGGPDVFLSKFDSWGNFEWARTWGSEHWDAGNAVAADSSGNVYVTGYFSDPVDFDPDGGCPHASNAVNDVFLSKFDSSGNFEWARTWGAAYFDQSRAVAADGSGHVYVTGYFSYTVDFNPDGGDPHSASGYADVFLSRFDTSGNFEWARTWGGSHIYAGDYGHGVCTDGHGNAFVTGWFRNTVDFSPSDPVCQGEVDEHASSGAGDSFLVKYLPDGCW